MKITVNSKNAIKAVNKIAAAMQGNDSILEMSVCKDEEQQNVRFRGNGNFDAVVGIKASISEEGSKTVCFPKMFVTGISTLGRLADEITIELQDEKAVIKAGSGHIEVLYSSSELAMPTDMEPLGTFTVNSSDLKEAVNAVKYCIETSKSSITEVNCVGITPITKDSTKMLKLVGMNSFTIAVSGINVAQCQFAGDMPGIAVPVLEFSRVMALIDSSNINLAIFYKKGEEEIQPAFLGIAAEDELYVIRILNKNSINITEDKPYEVRESAKFKAVINKAEFLEALQVVTLQDATTCILQITNGRLRLEDNCGKNYVDLTAADWEGEMFSTAFSPLLLANAINAIKDESFIFNTNGKLIISQKESPQSKFLATISYVMEEKRAMCSLILPVTNAKVKKIQAEQLKKQQQEQENAATTVATE